MTNTVRQTLCLSVLLLISLPLAMPFSTPAMASVPAAWCGTWNDDFKTVKEQYYGEQAYKKGLAWYHGAEGKLQSHLHALGCFLAAVPFPEGHWMAGHMFYSGEGTDRDYREAANHFRRCAEQDFPPCLTWMGLIYERGDGVTRDRDQALAWFKKALARAKQVGDAETAGLATRGIRRVEIAIAEQKKRDEVECFCCYREYINGDPWNVKNYCMKKTGFSCPC